LSGVDKYIFQSSNLNIQLLLFWSENWAAD